MYVEVAVVACVYVTGLLEEGRLDRGEREPKVAESCRAEHR